VLLAALGASTFVAFTLPHMPLSNTRHLVGGYLVGAAVGGVCQTLLLAGVLESMGIPHDAGRTLLAGVGVGVSMLAMVVLDMEHAPAASITLGLILDHPVPANIVYVVAGIIVLATVKRLLKPVMIDLL
jgi:CBS-domain-containing membrane protein